MSTILVADDNSNIQKMVGIALKDHGIQVIAVGNGEAAVRKLSESVPDLILADIFMPVRNGYEVCEYVKKDDRFAHVPVILLVGAFDPLDEREVERVRADGVLKKPFVPPDPLIELVKSLLSKAAAAAPAESGREAEDVNQTQDVAASAPVYSPTGTVRIPAPEAPLTEKTQRLEPEAPPEKTQRLEPEETPAGAGAEHFKLGLAEPPPASQVEKTQQLSATDISKILKRESSLTPPPAAEAEEDFAVPPSVVDFHGQEIPLAFEEMLRPAEAEEEEKSDLGAAALEAAEEDSAANAGDEAAIRFGGIREEAKTPDPELPPIPVDFGHSEPMEFLTEEHAEASVHDVGPAEDLVSSSSGWAASTAAPGGAAGAPEPDLEHEDSEGFLTPPAPPMRGIASEEVAPAPEFSIPAAEAAATSAPSEFDETSELPKHVLQEEVSRAQDIAARIAAQNREFMTREETAAPAAGTPVGIGPAMNVAESILAKHRAHTAADSASAAMTAETSPAVRPPAGAAPTPPANAFAQTVKVARPATAELIEAISERVLSQLDPYLVERITKEIMGPIVEAIIRKELEKLE